MMSSDGFLRRWAHLKSAANAQLRTPPAPPPAGPAASAAPVAPPEPSEPAGPAASRLAVARLASEEAGAAVLPTLEDAARLTAQSDYSAFVARGVDKRVRRLALKKLFSDPHFNLMDGLDIYMGDYNRADPLPATMLAALRQAQGFLQQSAESGEAGDASADSTRLDRQDGPGIGMQDGQEDHPTAGSGSLPASFGEDA